MSLLQTLSLSLQVPTETSSEPTLPALSADSAEVSFETAWQASVRSPLSKSGNSLPLAGKNLPTSTLDSVEPAPNTLTSAREFSGSPDAELGGLTQKIQNLPAESKPLLSASWETDTTTPQAFISVEDLSRAIIATSTPAPTEVETAQSAVAPKHRVLHENASASGRGGALIDRVSFSTPLQTRSPDNDQPDLRSTVSPSITTAANTRLGDAPLVTNRDPSLGIVNPDKLSSQPIESQFYRGSSAQSVQREATLNEQAPIAIPGSTQRSQRSSVDAVMAQNTSTPPSGPVSTNAGLNTGRPVANPDSVQTDAPVQDNSETGQRLSLNAIRNLHSATPNDAVPAGFFRETPKTELAASAENRQATNATSVLREPGLVEGRPLTLPATPSAKVGLANAIDPDDQTALAAPQRAIALDTNRKAMDIESRLLAVDSAIQGMNTNVSDRLFRVSRLDVSPTAVTEELTDNAELLPLNQIVRKAESLAPASVRGPFGVGQSANSLNLGLAQFNTTLASSDSLPANPTATAGQSAIDLSNDQRIPNERASTNPMTGSLNGRGEIEVIASGTDGQDQSPVTAERKTGQILSTNQDSPLLVRDLGALRPAVTDVIGRMQTGGGLPTSPLSATAPELPEQIGERVVIAAAGQLGKAEIRLTPQGMGSIQIDIQYTDDGANVQLQAVNAQARELLEAGLPRLREMLDNAGIRLNDAAVSHGGTDQRGGESGKSAHGERTHAGRSLTSSADGSVTESDVEQKPKARQNSVIDTYV